MEETMNTEEKSFAELFEEGYSGGGGENLMPGEKIRGEIVSIGMDTVFVNAGAKIDGAVERRELLDDDGNLPYAVGDVLELYVVCKRRSQKKLLTLIKGIDPQAFYITEQARDVSKVLQPVNLPVTGWRAVFKRK